MQETKRKVIILMNVTDKYTNYYSSAMTAVTFMQALKSKKQVKVIKVF